MVLVEGHRQGREGGTLLFDRPPAARALERSEDGSLPALSDRIAELTASVRARFDQAAPVAPTDKPAAEHAPKAQTSPPSIEKSSVSAPDDVGPSAASSRHASDATAVDDVPASEAVAPAPFTGVQINLRSGASERITDLTERVVWPVGEPVAEAEGTEEPAPPIEPAELNYFEKE